MATYADNYTFRIRGRYIAAGIAHVMKTRVPSVLGTLPLAEFHADAMNDYVSNFNSVIWADWAWTGWEYAVRDSDVWVPFAPVLTATIAGTQVVAGASAMQKITAVSHQGRAAGSRARVYWWGPRRSTDLAAEEGGDGVLTSAEASGLAASTTLASDRFAAGNGASAIFYERLTYKVNDYLLRLVRRGIIT